jgi:hypothetical protein
MKSDTFYTHPNPIQYQLEQWGALLLALLMFFASVGLFVLAFLIPAPLFGIMSLLVLLLLAPVLMLLLVTPPVQIEADGLRIKPRFGKERFIAWGQIERIEVYPLLPTANQEVLRQALVGRKQYRAAEGIMLIVPTLPAQYRIAGFFAGQKGAPILAFTNRSHSDYYALKEEILKSTEKSQGSS